MINPLEQEAYAKYSNPSFGGVELKRFLGLRFFESTADSIGRQLTDSERKLLVDFEMASETEPVMHKCSLCNGMFPGVWWKLPSWEFQRYLQGLKAENNEITYDDLKTAIEECDLAEYGCHFLNKQDPQKEIISFCGVPFPAIDRVQNGMQESCLRFHCTKDNTLANKEVVWGKRLSTVLKEQKYLKDEKDQNLAAKKTYEEEQAKKAEKKEQKRLVEEKLRADEALERARVLEERKKRIQAETERKQQEAVALIQKQKEERKKKSEELRELTGAKV